MKNAHANKDRDSKVRAVADRSTARKQDGSPAVQLVDNSPESLQLRKLQLMADNSPQAADAAQLQAMADRGPYSAAQRMLLEGSSGGPMQRQDAPEEEDLQMKAGPGPLQLQGMEEEEDLQMKAGPGLLQRQGMEEEEDLQMKAGPGPFQLQGMEEEEPLQGKFGPVQKKENKTGMPDDLKTGVENLSGISMDDVKVHYNSAKPATFQALAYTQGTDIHVGPGQEEHLPHEAWHVVQQRQGSMKPTMQLSALTKMPKTHSLVFQLFDPEKMLEIARASTKVRELEAQASKLGSALYKGTHKTMSYTDSSDKGIYIQEGLSDKEAALAYAYELQNVINVDLRYSQVIADAREGKISDPDEYATKMLAVEAEALIAEGEVAIEIDFTENANQIATALVTKHKKGEFDRQELLIRMIALTEKGTIEGTSAREWYKNQFNTLFKK